MRSIWTFLFLGFLVQPVMGTRGIVPCEGEDGAEATCTIDESTE